MIDAYFMTSGMYSLLKEEAKTVVLLVHNWKSVS